MPKKKSVNLLFGLSILILAGAAIVAMVFNPARPLIREAEPPQAQTASGLPEGHPPIDLMNRVAQLEQMSQNDPQNAEHKTQIGNAYYDMGQYQKAVEAYQESLKLRPQEPNVETDLATCLHYLGQEDKSLELLDNVLRYRPNFPQAMFNKGIVLLDGKKDPAGAAAVWEELLQKNPDFPQKAELQERIRQIKR